MNQNTDVKTLADLADIRLLEVSPENWQIPLMDGDPVLLAPLQIATCKTHNHRDQTTTTYVWIGTTLGGIYGLRLISHDTTPAAILDTHIPDRLRNIVTGPIAESVGKITPHMVLSVVAGFANDQIAGKRYGGQRFLRGETTRDPNTEELFTWEVEPATSEPHVRFDIQDQVYGGGSGSAPKQYIRPDNVLHVWKWAIVRRTHDRLRGLLRNVVATIAS